MRGEPCLNGGTCTDGVNAFTCACAARLQRHHLRRPTSTSARGNPCLNGGTCADGINSFTCTCAPGFSGTTCTDAPTGTVRILLHCDATSMPLNVFNGNGCFGPIAGGASYADLTPGTASIRVWSGANCTGCSRTITGDLSFCSASFNTGGAGCTGGLNDAVASVSIP